MGVRVYPNSSTLTYVIKGFFFVNIWQRAAAELFRMCSKVMIKEQPVQHVLTLGQPTSLCNELGKRVENFVASYLYRDSRKHFLATFYVH